MPDDGGPAFPCEIESGNSLVPYDKHPGMSLRDWFAGESLKGIRAGKYINYRDSFSRKEMLWKPDDCARQAYKDADAMLAEREKKK